ncbi:MAG: TraR/DksA family transcriptional regulator [Sphingomonadales bacterium]|nr:TraR/DksA family transcriptional regulator [Sphingomonadales bacterium]MBU3991769.1 TraR/DksA family transcriptional regulator [Alphaproteobacteria bacterium]
MTQYQDLAEDLKARLADLSSRARVIEDNLRNPLEADSSEQAIDLADDEALAGIDEVLRQEIREIREALLRIDNGTYGTCVACGNAISRARLQALPTAVRCINCA